MSYGVYQDAHFEVKFTDVDYRVFSDAAAYVQQGASPYERATYRYTPLLAMMLVPNYYLFEFGKMLFSLANLGTGLLLERALKRRQIPNSTLKKIVAFWLLNPFVISISTRGNAESLMCFLVLLVLDCLDQQRFSLAALIYGLAVHFKIYPIIYALPIWLNIPSKLGFFSWERIKFGLISGFSFISLGIAMYFL